jgi:hypothetical protein
MSTFRKHTLVFLVVAALLFTWTLSPALAASEDWTRQEASGVAMGFDLIVLRPLGLAATVGGVALFIVSLPFSALGGNTDEAANKLVKAPFAYTFNRPLGHEIR